MFKFQRNKNETKGSNPHNSHLYYEVKNGWSNLGSYPGVNSIHTPWHGTEESLATRTPDK